LRNEEDGLGCRCRAVLSADAAGCGHAEWHSAVAGRQIDVRAEVDLHALRCAAAVLQGEALDEVVASIDVGYLLGGDQPAASQRGRDTHRERVARRSRSADVAKGLWRVRRTRAKTACRRSVVIAEIRRVQRTPGADHPA